MPRLNGSIAWKHFDKCPQREKRAICKYCNKELSYRGTTTNLLTHLRLVHTSVHKAIKQMSTDEATSSDKIKDEFGEAKPPQKKFRFSPIWKYFTDTEDDNKARCKMCGAECTNNSNCRKSHLKSNHFAEYMEFESALNKITSKRRQDSVEDDTSSDSSVKLSSEIVGYFEQHGDGSRCSVCQQTTESTLEDMKTHLEEDHPAILISILQDDEVNKEDTFTEVVYLEDDPPHKKRKSEVTYKTETPQNPDSADRPDIDSFINYIRVLLLNVPKEAMPKLQLDVISCILNAQIKPTASNPCVCKVTDSETSKD